LNVFENVVMGIPEDRARDLGRDEVLRRIVRSLEDVNLDPEIVMSKLPAELSGGMRKRVGLARAIVSEPRIILYDEPVTGLDPVNAVAVDRLITDIAERTHVTSIVVTHDVEGALEISDRVSLLEGGKMRFLGTPDEFRRSDDPLVRAFADRKAAVAAALEGSARSSRIADAKTPALP
jgi:phospholipid/cholesterol/gamma-HCH transport system ATP-binding protein